MKNLVLVLAVNALAQAPLIWADPSPVPSPMPVSVTPGSATQPRPETQFAASESKNRKRKGRIPREKDAEGTEAPHRFNNTDIIIKSKYELNGQSLEVDTD